MVEIHIDGILSYCYKQVFLGFIESDNLKTRNFILMAYGYREKEYMKFKIIQPYTPWVGKSNPWTPPLNN